jgi:hypothetical protein
MKPSRIKASRWIRHPVYFVCLAGFGGIVYSVWRYVDWKYIQGAPTAMGNLEMLVPMLIFAGSSLVLFVCILPMLAVALLGIFNRARGGNPNKPSATSEPAPDAASSSRQD